MLWYVLGETELSGQGITSKALKLVVRYCFDKLNLVSVYAWLMEGNEASRKVLMNVGFREAGRVREAASLQGQQVDRVYFDIIPSEVL
jgi:ribosomal-protein-alanine N-acetyltransferase